MTHYTHVCCCENECLQSANSSCASNESYSTHTSGYQTDDGTIEGKILSRASQSRPANLRMTAIRDYSPCCHEELAVRKGQRVKVLYKNNDWVYALTKAGEAGYVPYTYVRPSRKYAGYQSEPEYCQETDAMYQSGYDTDLPVAPRRARVHAPHYHGNRAQISDVSNRTVHNGFGSPEMKSRNHSLEVARQTHISGYTSAVESYNSPSAYIRHPRPAKSLHCILDASHRPVDPKPTSYQRTFLEELVVIHDFEAKEEDEVFVGKGERVKVLNADDPAWLWVETTPGDEGFVPRNCCTLGNHECELAMRHNYIIHTSLSGVLLRYHLFIHHCLGSCEVSVCMTSSWLVGLLVVCPKGKACRFECVFSNTMVWWFCLKWLSQGLKWLSFNLI